jgi:membrane protease YdiL (CAAX protease family)
VTGGRAPWPVLAALVLAFLLIVVFSVVAAGVVRELHPDVSDAEAFRGLPALVAGALASSIALLVATLLVARPLTAAALGLVPGRETGPVLVVAVLGILALGQTLDSLAALAGLTGHGALAFVRDALRGAAGPELVLAIAVLGPGAGMAEEVFFRGYVQRRLAAVWRPAAAIGGASAGFGLLHLEPVHGLLALVLGAYLGFVAHRTGSTLPAVVCHAVNNAVFTVLAAALPATTGPGWQLVLGVASLAVFAACLRWLARALPA